MTFELRPESIGRVEEADRRRHTLLRGRRQGVEDLLPDRLFFALGKGKPILFQ